MATDPRPPHNRPRKTHLVRPRRALYRSWWQQSRRPLAHLVVAAVCVPAALLFTAGDPVLTMLVVIGATALAAAEVLAQRRQHQRRRLAEGHAAQVVERIYEDWIVEQAARGHADLERWRRTHRP